ncbi:MAG TPA: hypothetical protein VF850_03235, partial [Gemmatimonadaceae bacterium]
VEGELTLTPLGREVLAGAKDWQRINKKTRWLGGVEIIPGETGWRWDPDKRELVRAGAAATRAKLHRGAVKKRPSPRAKKVKTRAVHKRASAPSKKSKPRSPARRAPRKKK